MGGADRASGYDNHDRRSEFWAGRLEIRLADTGTISPTAGQAATRTIASVEFQVIGARSNRPDDDGEATVAVNVGRNNAKFTAVTLLVTPCRVIEVQAPPGPLGNWPNVLGNVLQKM